MVDAPLNQASSLLTPSTIPSLPIATSPSPQPQLASTDPRHNQTHASPYHFVPPTSLPALALYTHKDTTKILVRFKAIGAAPIMKNNSFRITAFNKFQAVVVFLRKELGEKATGGAGGTLFLYINNSFAPSLDDTVGNLFRCFGTDGHLIVNYSTTPAFG